jgi:DNA mismatch repair ATPase MutS
MDQQTCRSLNIFPESVESETKNHDKLSLFGQFKLHSSIGKKVLRKRMFSPSSDPLKIKKW